MPKQLVFIDEHGDAGLTGSKSSRFIIAAVVMVRENEDDLIRAKIIEYKRSLGWHDREEFKFSRTRKTFIKELLKLLTPFDFGVYCVVLDKKKEFNNPQTSNRYSLYNYVLVELLKCLPDGDKRIYIDCDVGKRYRKNTLTFLRKQLGEENRITNFKYLNSNSSEELQLADLVVGSIGRSYSDHQDSKDYITLLNDKIVQIKEL